MGMMGHSDVDGYYRAVEQFARAYKIYLEQLQIDKCGKKRKEAALCLHEAKEIVKFTKAENKRGTVDRILCNNIVRRGKTP